MIYTGERFVYGKNVYVAAVRWNVLCMSFRSIWSTVLFKPAVSLPMIYLLLKARY